MPKIKRFETWTEAFDFATEGMESPEIEQADAAYSLIIKWLHCADVEIAELKKELRETKNGCK